MIRNREADMPDSNPWPGARLHVVQRLWTRIPAWKWLIGLGFVAGFIPVVIAFTVHNRCSNTDPGCVFHHYTTVDIGGLWSLGVIAGPTLINLIVAIALHVKVTRRSVRADRVALCFAVLSWFVGFAGLLIMGFVTLIEAALTTCAVAVAPLPPDPSDPLAGPGAGYFGSRPIGRR
jgi:hypothetical protein